MDNDGDLDVIASSGTGSDDLLWWINDGSPDGAGWTEVVIEATCDACASVYAVDMDADGDIDVVTVSNDDNDVLWYKNDGSPTGANSFTKYTIDGDFSGAVAVYARDMDNDGDVDVIAAAETGDDVSWWANDGTPSNDNWTETIIDGDFDGARSVHTADMDGDGYNNTVELDCMSDDWNSTTIPPDTDADGECDALDPDIDGDGLPNEWEEERGFDPQDPESMMICHGETIYCLRTYDDFTFPETLIAYSTVEEQFLIGGNHYT